MSVSRVAEYDEMPVFVANGRPSFVEVAARGEIPEGLSIAFVLGEDLSQDEIAEAADLAAKLAPVVVHCFGVSSEAVHDAIDAALVMHGNAGIPTCWTVEYEPAEVIFELFCTDLPSEDDFDRWSGRLFVVDRSLDQRVKDGILNGLRDVDATVQSAVRGRGE